MGGPIQGHDPDQRRSLSASAASQSRYDGGGTPRQTGAVFGGYSGRAAVRREQCGVLNNANTLVAICMITRA
jgi:hypothetical protein